MKVKQNLDRLGCSQAVLAILLIEIAGVRRFMNSALILTFLTYQEGDEKSNDWYTEDLI